MSSCVNESFVTQLGSLRLDIAFLESRFNGELVSQINSLQTKQNYLESIVRKQDEIIWKLNDDNLLLKSRLLSLEQYLRLLSENNSPIPISNHVDDQLNDSKLNTVVKFLYLMLTHNIFTVNSHPYYFTVNAHP